MIAIATPNPILDVRKIENQSPCEEIMDSELKQTINRRSVHRPSLSLTIHPSP